MSPRARLLTSALLALLGACSSPPAGLSGADAGGPPPAAADAGAPGPVDASGQESGPVPDGGAAPGMDASPEASSDAPGGPVATTLRVHYPAGSHTITLRGSAAPWSWTAGAKMTAGPSDTWTVTSTAVKATLEFKPMLDDATWSLGPNYKVTPGATVDVYPRFTQVSGTYSRAYDFTSQLLGNTRGIWIYLPPTYIENTDASMPVVYMHDGQNLFDPSASFNGTTWQVQQTMDAAAMDGSIAEALVIGVENTADRMTEYTPVPDPTQNPSGGGGAKYLQMLAQELKPRIDHDLRTLPDRAHTYMVGSSLGGLITAYAGVTQADVFGLVGVMSPSTWWDSDWIIGDVGTTPSAPRPLRVYVDSGNAGPSNDDVTQTAQLAAGYKTLGYASGSTLDYVVQNGGQHSETYWAQRLPGALTFLLGPGR